jgi:hypothetical protein
MGRVFALAGQEIWRLPRGKEVEEIVVLFASTCYNMGLFFPSSLH